MVHPARHGSCTPAPAREEHGHFELTGPGGIKALRVLVLGSAEWCSPAAREAVAAAEEAAGDPSGIARILRNKRGRNLTKPHLMLLCAAWDYRTDKWCAPRARAPRNSFCFVHAAHAALACPTGSAKRA